MNKIGPKRGWLAVGIVLVAIAGAGVWAFRLTDGETSDALRARDENQMQEAEQNRNDEIDSRDSASTQTSSGESTLPATERNTSRSGTPLAPTAGKNQLARPDTERSGLMNGTSKSDALESRRHAGEAAQNIQALIRGFAGASSRDSIESGLTKSGLVLTRAAASTGSTGVRTRTETARLGALVTARLDWKGKAEKTLALEHARLVHANESVDFDDLVTNYERVLSSEGWSRADSLGPRGAVIWRDTSRGLMLVLAPHDADSPHPYEGLPENVSITTIHDDHEH